jgi:pilus assembly protein CpaB
MQQGLLPIGQQQPSDATGVEEEGEPARPAEAVSMLTVVGAGQPIPRGDVITADHLFLMKWPSEHRLEAMFIVENEKDEENVEQVFASIVSRQTRHDIPQGMPLTSDMIIDVNKSLDDTGSLAALRIKKGMVAIPIPVDRLSSVAYALRPGDHVSVIGSFRVVDVDTEFQSLLPNNVGGVISTGFAGEDQPPWLTIQVESPFQFTSVGRTELDPLLNELVYVMPMEIQRPRVVTQIMIQDAIILRYGEFSYEDLRPQELAPAEGEEGQEQGEPAAEVAQPEHKPPDIVTLIVSPQEAVELEYLMRNEVDITLVLRSAGDTDPSDTEAVTFQYMLETYNIPVPAKLPYGFNPGIGTLEPVESPE